MGGGDKKREKDDRNRPPNDYRLQHQLSLQPIDQKKIKNILQKLYDTLW